MMSELSEFMVVVDHDKDDALRLAGRTAQRLESKQATLIEVVQSLGGYINDEDAIIRGKAVSYLTAVIKALPAKFLSRQQVQVLTTFYCDRIEDGGAIAGLAKLQSLDRFNKEMVQMVARALFEHAAQFQARLQSQRFYLLQFLNELMLNHREALLDMKDESLLGVVDLVNGERDPRNLMLVFSILKVLMVEWDISKHVQKTVFDSVYKYFPITFRPPPNDPYKISAQDLKLRLQNCISATQLFAPYSFPLLLDKLDSTSTSVKRDAVHALGACISSYEPATVARYSITLWESLKFEILNGQEDLLAEECMDILQSLAKRLSPVSSAPVEGSHLSHYLKPIMEECNDQLREPQLKQAKSAQRILSSLSVASPAAFNSIIQAVMPPLLTTYQKFDETGKKRLLVETIVDLLGSAMGVFGTLAEDSPESVVGSPLLMFKDRLTQLLNEALMDSAKKDIPFRLAALKGMLQLSLLRDFFESSEVELFVKHLTEILRTEQFPSGELREGGVAALAAISKYEPQLIIDITFPAFTANIPEPDSDIDTKCLASLEILAEISAESAVLEVLVWRLLRKLESTFASEARVSSSYAHAILMTILYAMRNQGSGNKLHLATFYDKIVRNLCRQAALASMRSGGSTAFDDPLVLDTLGRLCNLIVRNLPHNDIPEVSDNVYTLYAAADGFVPVPFGDKSAESHRGTMMLSTYLLAGLPRNTANIPYTKPDMNALLQEIIKLAVLEDNLSIQLSIVHQLALLVNKFLPTSHLDTAAEILFSLIPTLDKNEKSTSQMIRTIFWLSKALALRLAPATTKILSTLIELLASPDPIISDMSARGFSLLLSSDDVLSTENHANIRLLAKQRVFAILVPLISSRVSKLNHLEPDPSGPSPCYGQTKKALLTALSGVLSAIPSSLIMSELATLFPLLLQSLDLTGRNFQSIKAGALDTISVVVGENGVSAIAEIGYLDDLVARLLSTGATPRLADGDNVDDNNNPPEVRFRALQCLLLIAKQVSKEGIDHDTNGKISRATILRLKTTVIRTLRLMFDDPKRDVRKAAVDAQAAWLRHVEEVEDDDF